MLIEATIATVLVTVFLTSLYLGFTDLIRNLSRTENQAKAVNALTSAFEAIRTRTYANITSSSGVPVAGLPSGVQDTTVTETPASAGAGEKTVTVVISWTDAGQARSVTASTIVVNGGLNP